MGKTTGNENKRKPRSQSLIRKLKQIENNSRKETQLFPRFAERLSRVLVSIDTTGIITYVSQAVQHFTGYAFNEIIGRPYFEFLADEETETASAGFKALVAGNTPTIETFVGIRRKNGTTWWAECNLEAFYDTKKCIGIAGLLLDITERVEQQQLLLRKNRLLQAINEFSSIVANTPDENLLPFLGQRLLSKLNCVLAWISFYDPDTSEMVINHIASSEQESPLIREIIETRMYGGRRTISPSTYNELLRKGFIVTDSFQKVTFGGISDEKCEEIVNDLCLKWFVGVVLVHDDQLQGTLIVTGRSGQTIPEKDEVMAFAGVTANAIYRKTARDALANSEERFRKLVKNSSDFLEIIDREGNELFVNGAVEKITGYSQAEVVGTNVFNNIHREDVDSLKKTIQQIVKYPELPLRVEYRQRCKDGNWKQLEAIGSNFLDDPVIGGIVVNVREISERKLSEEKLARSSELYRLVVENAKDMIIVTRGVQIVFSNSITHHILGYSEQELSETSFIDFIHPEDRSLSVERYTDSNRGIPLPKSLMRFITRDGSIRWTECTGVNIVWDDQPAVLSFISDITDRLLMEQALKDSELKFRNYIRLAPISVTITDPNGRITAANPATSAMTGYSERELIGQTLFELAMPEFHSTISEKLKHISENDQIQACFQVKHKDGHLIWIDVIAVQLEPDLSIGFSRDVTSSIRNIKLITAQKDLALKISQATNFTDILKQYLETGLEVSEMDCGGIYLIDPQVNKLQLMIHSGLNPAFAAEVSEYECNSVQWEIVSKQVPSYLSNIQSMSSYASAPDDFLLKSIAVIPILSEGQVIGCLNVGSRTNEFIPENSQTALETIAGELGPTIARQLINIRLLERESNLQTFLNSTQDLLFIISLTGIILEVNPIATELLGFEKLFLIGKHISDLVDPDNRELIERSILNVNDKQKTELFLPFFTVSGDRIPLETRLTPGQWNGQPVFFAVSRDISERIRSEAVRINLERQLQQSQKLESLGIMAGGVAHDFNNILMAMLGYTELGLHKLPETSPVRDHLHQIQKNIHRASDLTRQMLAYAGKASFIMMNLNLADLVMELGDLIKASISRNVMITYELNPNLPMIKGDPNQIQHVIMNLLMNAAEAIGDRAGIIKIAGSVCRLDDDPFIRMAWPGEIIPGEYINLSISDTGCGMDQEILARVFEPFFTTKFTGRGLGLASVQGIVLGHKGTMRVSSEPGKGTTFELFLPTERSSGKNAEEKIDLIDQIWKGTGTILLAEDEADLREICSEMLESMGFLVVTARDGQEAIELFKAKQHEITSVILDLTMPKKSGVEVLQFIHNIQPSIKVVLTSGFSKEDVLTRLGKHGFAGFLSKPYTFQDLRQVIGRVYQQGQK